MGIAVGGLTFWMSHLVQHQELVWKKSTNPQPYLHIQQHETTKFYDYSGYFKGKWSRDRL
jgi:NADH-ubiquinone reductase complex 1 MLRQ subunit